MLTVMWVINTRTLSFTMNLAPAQMLTTNGMSYFYQFDDRSGLTGLITVTITSYEWAINASYKGMNKFHRMSVVREGQMTNTTDLLDTGRLLAILVRAASRRMNR